MHLDTNDRETVLQAIEYFPLTHHTNDGISRKKIKLLVSDVKESVTFTTEEIQFLIKKLKEACVYDRVEKIKSYLMDLTLFCVNDHNISLVSWTKKLYTVARSCSRLTYLIIKLFDFMQLFGQLC
ncbi:uncharacterized protein LOC131950361 [Physella acuta]|uniref:uncharacterized protein LOC131950361 n=1 Tax=Physella acuta TaxID=109671 RepID=UPI0027DD12D1|nr:uncharacterized protein LOC131950361 [Physella acuta]